MPVQITALFLSELFPLHQSAVEHSPTRPVENTLNLTLHGIRAIWSRKRALRTNPARSTGQPTMQPPKASTCPVHQPLLKVLAQCEQNYALAQGQGVRNGLPWSVPR